MALDIGMVTIDCADPNRLADFWTKALGTEVAADYGEFLFLAGSPALGFQRVPDLTPGKNRLHLDLRTEDRTGEVARLVALGATVVKEHSSPMFEWTVLADPEGNQFCVAMIENQS